MKSTLSIRSKWDREQRTMWDLRQVILRSRRDRACRHRSSTPSLGTRSPRLLVSFTCPAISRCDSISVNQALLRHSCAYQYDGNEQVCNLGCVPRNARGRPSRVTAHWWWRSRGGGRHDMRVASEKARPANSCMACSYPQLNTNTTQQWRPTTHAERAPKQFQDLLQHYYRSA